MSEGEGTDVQPMPRFEAIAAPLDELLVALARDARPDSLVVRGERIAAMIATKSEPELTVFAAKVDDDAGDAMVTALIAAQASLAARSELVNGALARLGLVTSSGDRS
jgi:hypothetical protein